MATNNRPLKAYVRYDGLGKVVSSSLIWRKDKPKVGNWKEVQGYECCDNNSCTPNYSPWRIVKGGVAGDGVVLIDDLGPCSDFTFIGPNDKDDDGWVYLKQFFTSETCLEIEYKWTSFDDLGPTPPTVDFPVYWTSVTEPTGIPEDLTPKVGSTPDDGIWNVTVPAGQWFAIGIYSDDSCCGRGFLQVEICRVECPEPTTTTTTTQKV